MAIRIAGGNYTFRLLPALSSFLLILLLIGLGTWQVHRAVWKENLIADITARRQAAPLELTGANKQDDELNYRQARARGHFQSGKNLYMAAISLKGEGGYAVLTPFKLSDGGWLLVNRGWIPYDGRASVTTPPYKTDILGTLRVATRPGWMLPANQPQKDIWYSIDLPIMAQALGVSGFLPYVLEVADTDPSSYPIGGQTRFELPNNHRGYALTWYSLAIVQLVIYGLSSWKREKK